jgi:hypothetical protein
VLGRAGTAGLGGRATRSPGTAGINGAAGQPNAFVAQVEPTPFCDRWVLLVEKQANPPIHLQNIEDIELTVKSRSNVPPPFFN